MACWDSASTAQNGEGRGRVGRGEVGLGAGHGCDLPLLLSLVETNQRACFFFFFFFPWTPRGQLMSVHRSHLFSFSFFGKIKKHLIANIKHINKKILNAVKQH